MQTLGWDEECEVRRLLAPRHGDARRIAARIGMPYSTVAQQLKPDRSGARRLTLELVHNAQVTGGDFSPYRHLLGLADHACYPLPFAPPAAPLGPERLLVLAARELGDVARELETILADNRVTREEARALHARAMAAVARLATLDAAIAARAANRQTIMEGVA